tara:strand:+ start:90 stop:479 length:390 start_codon:yes stop_codon:yes gene_type:complete
MLKSLVASLAIIILFLFSMPYKAYGSEDYYKVGDIIPVLYVCRDLDRMLKIAEVDIKDSSKVKSIMRLMFKTNTCVMFPKVIQSKIKEIVLSYKDSEQRKSYLLELESKLDIPVYIWYMDPVIKSKVKV